MAARGTVPKTTTVVVVHRCGHAAPRRLTVPPRLRVARSAADRAASLVAYQRWRDQQTSDRQHADVKYARCPDCTHTEQAAVVDTLESHWAALGVPVPPIETFNDLTDRQVLSARMWRLRTLRDTLQETLSVLAGYRGTGSRPRFESLVLPTPPTGTLTPPGDTFTPLLRLLDPDEPGEPEADLWPPNPDTMPLLVHLLLLSVFTGTLHPFATMSARAWFAPASRASLQRSARTRMQNALLPAVYTARLGLPDRATATLIFQYLTGPANEADADTLQRLRDAAPCDLPDLLTQEAVVDAVLS